MASTYITTSGDTWDLIAYTEMGSERYMRELMEANRELSEVLRFDAGTKITIPDLPEDNSTDLPFWRSDDNYAWAEEAE